ncbi:MAG: bi-domain-containing oxidoreductase [Planctomycetota bacterium]|nr:bi-domain-containing oxidoreductase [Planctomycetota bacterium]
MLTLVQDFKKGELLLVETPIPSLESGGVLVRNHYSFVSPGTELATLRFAKKSLLGKALARRDLLAKVLDKIKREGFFAAFKAAMVRLEEPLPLGYSSAGIVEAVADDAVEFKVGDRVACAGVGFASHAEQIFVPKNLTVKVPENVSLRDASSIALGAIAIESYRVAELHLGETVVVMGLGVIGQILVQILRSAGCNVIGFDPNGKRVEETKSLGFERVCSDDKELLSSVAFLTKGSGADCVIISAATESNEPVETAPHLLRKRGTVVILGDTGLKIPRKPYYEKELQIRFSTSYGPGRYDPQYEIYGQDYPIAHARWTEKRNMEAYLNLLAKGSVKLDRIFEGEYPIEEGLKIYEQLDSGKLRSAIFKYKTDKELSKTVHIPLSSSVSEKDLKFGIIGAGAFARSVLIPALLGLGAKPVLLCTRSPAKSALYAKKFGFKEVTSDIESVFNSNVNFIVIATPHSEHAKLLKKSLEAHKPAFCEKPLAINHQEFEDLIKAYNMTKTPFLIGFNRRFSPAIAQMKENLSDGIPMLISYIVNAGKTDLNSWLAQPQEGGRIVGEVCHFVDTVICLAASEVETVVASAPPQKETFDECAATLRFKNGSVSQILYSTCGAPRHTKERIEVHSSEKTIILEDFRRLFVIGNRKKGFRFGPASKGHREELAHFLKALKGETSLDEYIKSAFSTTAATLAIITAIKNQTTVTPYKFELGDVFK